MGLSLWAQVYGFEAELNGAFPTVSLKRYSIQHTTRRMRDFFFLNFVLNCFQYVSSSYINLERISEEIVGYTLSGTLGKSTQARIHVNQSTGSITLTACDKAIYCFASPTSSSPAASLSLSSEIELCSSIPAVNTRDSIYAVVAGKKNANCELVCWSSASGSLTNTTVVLHSYF